MDESGFSQNRRSQRSHLLMAARLEVSGRSIEVKLRNLSSEGARVEGGELPVEGTTLLFRKGELALPASIIWSDGRQAGLRFDKLLDPETVLNHIPAPRARMKPDFRRPGLLSRALTDQERKLAERWIGISPKPPLGN